MQPVPTTPVEVKVFLIGSQQPHEMVFINVVPDSVHVLKEKGGALAFKQINGVRVTIGGLPWMIEDLSGAKEVFAMKKQRVIDMNTMEREAMAKLTKERLDGIEKKKQQSQAQEPQQDIPLKTGPVIGSDDPNLDDEETPEVTPLEGEPDLDEENMKVKEAISNADFDPRIFQDALKTSPDSPSDPEKMATSPIDSEAPKANLPDPKLL
jgi:hypothetical protein